MKKNNNFKVEAIIPTLNEENTIGSIIDRTFQYVDNVIVVDGNSSDDTVEIAKNKGAQIILQNSRGKGAGLIEALQHTASDVVVILDGDGSMRPEEIPAFLGKIYSGADVTKGSRFISEGGSSDITLLRKFGNTLFTILVNIIWDSDFTDLCYGYMAFRRNVIKKLLPTLRSTHFDIEAEIIIKAKKLGFKISEVPSFELKRKFGQSNLSTIKDGSSILSTIIREILNKNHI